MLREDTSLTVVRSHEVVTRPRRLALTALALALSGCAVATAPAPRIPAADTNDGPRAERPTFALGDRWIRSDGIWELIRVEPDQYVFSANADTELHLSRDLFIARFTRLGRSMLEFKPLPKLEWPLRVGIRGGATGRFAWLYQEYDADMVWRVDAYEDVSVPAGTFKAFRIVVRVVPRVSTNFGPTRRWDPSAPSVEMTHWYAPEARQFVKAEGTWLTAFDLVAVDPGDNEPLTVRVREPQDQSIIPGDADVVVAGTASTGKALARVDVTVNGENIATETPRGDARKTITFKAPLRLRDGKNVVIVTATDTSGTTTQEARTLFYVAPLKVAFPAVGSRTTVERAHIALAIPVPRDRVVGSLAVAANGVVVDSAHGSAITAAGYESRITLAQGENRIRIRYDLFDRGQHEQVIEDRTIVFDPAAAAPAEQLAEEQRLAAAQRQVEAQRAEDQRLADERKRVEAERRRAEAQRLADEARKRAEEQRVSEEHRKRAEELRLAALPPLSLTLSSPVDQARFEHESIGLAGMAASGKGVSRVSIALNGVEVSRQEDRTPQRAMALSLPVTLREGQNTLVVTATETDGTVTQEVRTVFFERPHPLTVAMRFPQDQMRVSDAVTVAAAVVSSSRGVARVAVSLNGVEVHQQTEKTPPRSQLVTVPLKLQPGVNVVAISASDGAGVARQEMRTVFFDTAQTVPAPPPAPTPAHERWAVVIGIGQYEHPSIPSLRFTVADAEAIYATLLGVGFKKEHVLLLTDKGDKKPTLKNIKWALGTFLARSARKDDTVLIFFAGHGAPETDPRGLERDGLAKYLIPSDADEDDLYSSALPMEELQTIFSRIESERVVAFLDACYSGAAGGRTFAARKTRAAGIDDQFLERLTRTKGRAIITASRPTEVSIELAELGHGIFTYYLVNGLKGAGDLNRDGIITLQELYEYVEQQVRIKSRAVGGNQHPVMKGELEGILPLARVPSR